MIVWKRCKDDMLLISLSWFTTRKPPGSESNWNYTGQELLRNVLNLRKRWGYFSKNISSWITKETNSHSTVFNARSSSKAKKLFGQKISQYYGFYREYSKKTVSVFPFDQNDLWMEQSLDVQGISTALIKFRFLNYQHIGREWFCGVCVYSCLPVTYSKGIIAPHRRSWCAFNNLHWLGCKI